MSEPAAKDRNLSLELVRVTEAAALAASRHMGSGDHINADRAAISAAQTLLSSLAINGTIRVGESCQEDGGDLCVDTSVGIGEGPKVDVAIVALEGASIVARGGPNAVSTVAVAEGGKFLRVPDMYMDKLAVGPGLPDGIVSFENAPTENIQAVAQAKGIATEELVVCMLDRPRHSKLLDEVRKTGAKVRLILGGDLSGAVTTALPETGVDMYIGIGGASQGILAAAALRGFGGQMLGRLVFRKDEERQQAADLGIEDFDKIYDAEMMASGNVTFAATGVTYGTMLKGIRKSPNGSRSQSLVVRSLTGTYRYIDAYHDFSRRPPVA